MVAGCSKCFTGTKVSALVGGQVSKIRLEEVRLAGTLSLQVRNAGPKCSNCPRERNHQKFQTFTCPNCFTDVLIREH